eukprot:TRINITY_DN8458_c0_g1_i2.p1 TRINITY_DN8458_c0_g1~~TRINITY_DN8458_c0_g1_i2.p1  ORF type:complete len:357 (-),score=38.74 TRINITY_DN8458_c0_g1_i2:530-1600(-)
MASAQRSIFLLLLFSFLVCCTGSKTKTGDEKHITRRSRELGLRFLLEKISTAGDVNGKLNKVKKRRLDYTPTTPTTTTPTTPMVTPTPPMSTSPTTPTTPVSGSQSWCVAKTNVPDKSVQTALDYACGLGGADCRPIQKGGACYEPETVYSHASYAFNYYYQKSNMAPGSCDFGGTAMITTANPSYGSCVYSGASSNGGNTYTPTTPPTGTGTPSTGTGTGTPSTGTGTGTGMGTPPAGTGTGTGMGTPPTGTGTGTGTGTSPGTTYPGTTPPGTFTTPTTGAVPPPPGAIMSPTSGGITTPSSGTFPGISMGPNSAYNNSPPYDASASAPSVSINILLTLALSSPVLLLVATILG